MDYTIYCKVTGSVSFTVSADSLEEAAAKGREKANKMSPFAKELDWIDGEKPVVEGVYQND